jgi:predicted DNA-binding protein
MTVKHVEYDRITFSLPHSMNIALDTLKNEISRSKSEIIKLAIESYLNHLTFAPKKPTNPHANP